MIRAEAQTARQAAMTARSVKLVARSQTIPLYILERGPVRPILHRRTRIVSGRFPERVRLAVTPLSPLSSRLRSPPHRELDLLTAGQREKRIPAQELIKRHITVKGSQRAIFKHQV